MEGEDGREEAPSSQAGKGLEAGNGQPRAGAGRESGGVRVQLPCDKRELGAEG